jgi:hypothetical protein
MSTTTRALDLPADSPAGGWTVSLTTAGDVYTVTLHGPASGDVVAYSGADSNRAHWVYDCITGTSAYTDAWNRAVNA